MQSIIPRCAAAAIFLAGAAQVLRDLAIGFVDWAPIFSESEFLVFFSGVPFAYLQQAEALMRAFSDALVMVWGGAALLLTLAAGIVSDVILRKLYGADAVKFVIWLVILCTTNFLLMYVAAWLLLFVPFGDTTIWGPDMIRAIVLVVLFVAQVVLTFCFGLFFYRKTTYKSKSFD